MKSDRFKHALANETTSLLRERYAVEVDPATPIRYYLDFKSDRRLLELREAIARVDEGSYGLCLVCKRNIPVFLLERDPAERFCDMCMNRQHLRARTGKPHRRSEVRDSFRSGK